MRWLCYVGGLLILHGGEQHGRTYRTVESAGQCNKRRVKLLLSRTAQHIVQICFGSLHSCCFVRQKAESAFASFTIVFSAAGSCQASSRSAKRCCPASRWAQVIICCQRCSQQLSCWLGVPDLLNSAQSPSHGWYVQLMRVIACAQRCFTSMESISQLRMHAAAATITAAALHFCRSS